MFPTPTVVGDDVLIASCAGWLFALDRLSGEKQWRFDIKQAGALQFHSEMLVLEDRVIIGTDGKRGNAHALNLETGEELWTYPCGTALRVDLQQFDNTMIGVAKRNDIDELFCLDLTDGGPVWTVEHERAGAKAYANTPLLIDDRVYYGSAAGMMVYDAHTGDMLDAIAVGGAISTSLLRVDQHIYFGVGQQLVRLHLDSREIDRRFDVGGKLVGKPALLGDSIAIMVDWRSEHSRLVIVDEHLTSVRWQWSPERSSDFGTIARLHTHNDHLIMGTQGGRVFGVDIATGNTVWETSVNEAVRSASFHDGIMYVGTIPGTVYAIEFPNK